MSITVPLYKQGKLSDLERISKASFAIVSPSILKNFPWLAHTPHFSVERANWESVQRLWTTLRKWSNKRLVAIGGGKVLDVAKLAARLPSIEGDICHSLSKRKFPSVWDETRHLTLIPSTAGSGSEASAISVIQIHQIKTPLFHHSLMANEVLLLPELLYSNDQEIARNGLWDSLVHAVESYVSPIASKESQSYSLAALEKLWPHLHTNQRSPQSWLEIQRGSFYAGLAQAAASVGIAHALAHQWEILGLGRHGQLSAQMLGPSMEFHIQRKQGLYAPIAEYLSLDSEQELIEQIHEVSNSHWGAWQAISMNEEERISLIKAALRDPCSRTNPILLRPKKVLEWLEDWCFA